MRAYYASTISPNMATTPEGYLLCKNVAIARTGRYEYLGREVDPKLSDSDIVTVIRTPEEVFSPVAMSSFEGKPACNEHPFEGLNSENVMQYSRGYATNIRRGKGADADLLLADLLIQDKSLIDAIEAGKREVSAGYECDYLPNGDGTYRQANIVGNHVAVVAQGRAGRRVRINDSTTARETLGHRELMDMVDAKKHNHLSPEEIQQALTDGGERYVLTQVNLDGLSVEYHESLGDVKGSFDQSKTKPIIIGKDGFVIDGRHRVMAAIESGVKEIDAYVPVDDLWMYNFTTSHREGVKNDVDTAIDEAVTKYATDAEKSAYENADGTFKGGFDGAVKYFMSKGYSKEAATKIAGKIAAEKGKTGDESPEQETSVSHWVHSTDKKKVRDSSMQIKIPSRTPQSVRRAFAAMGFKQFAMDAEPDEIMDAWDAMSDEEKAEAEAKQKEDGKKGEVEPTKDDGADQERLKALEEQVAKLEKALEEAKKSGGEKSAEETLDAELSKLDSNHEDEEESKTVEPEEMTDDVVLPPEDRPKNPLTGDSAAKRAALMAIKPILASIPDEKTRKQVVDTAIASFKGRSGSNAYGQMARDTHSRTSKAQQKQQAEVVDYADLGMEIARKHNPHYKNKNA